MGGRAAKAVIYPRGLCRAMARGIKSQMQMDQGELMMVDLDGDLSREELQGLNELRANDEANDWKFWDDVSGKELGSELVKAARKEEIDVVRKMAVWTKVPKSQCLAETGRQPVGTRWVDTNKGDDSKPKNRSRIVAQELKRSSES